MKRDNSYFKNLKGELSLFLIALLCGLSLSAQTQQREEQIGLTIKGKVFDKNNNQPIEYATVTAFTVIDNKLLSGNITDSNGNFVVNGIKSKSLYLTVSFMGYQTQRINTIPEPINGIITIKSIELNEASKQLGAVDVVAKNRSIEYQLDKKVVDVASQLNATSATAIEVLENVPSVKVDMDGTVSLRGSTGFTVLIDGKPSPLESSDALRSIPASSILKIELITNPSAKYQPDGTAGIINVIMKKNRSLGINGIVNTNIGLYGTYGGDFLLNYRDEKIGYNLGADYNVRSNPGNTESQRVLIASDTFATSSNGVNNRDHIMMGLKGGMDYDFNPSNALAVGFRLGQRHMESGSSQTSTQTIYPSNLISQYNTNNSSKRGGLFGSVNLTYLHKFENNPDHTLKTQLDYNQAIRSEESLSEERDSLMALTKGLQNNEDNPRKNFQGALDYVLPFSNGLKVEAGYLGRYEMLSATASFDTLNVATNNYFRNTQYTTNSSSTQNIQALYSTFSGKKGVLSYLLGLRGEYTYRVIKADASPSNFVLDQWDYFPSIHISAKLPQEHELMANYSRRIERTRPWDLEPYITWSDANNVQQGNPSLKNQYIDAFEVGYMKQYSLFYLSLEGYYRITNNKIERLKTVYSNDVMLTTPYNIGKDYSLGIEGSISGKYFKFWDVTVMGTIYKYRIVGELKTSTVDKHSFDRESFNWNSRVNNTFTLTKNQQLQFNGSYNSKSVTAQGETSSYYVCDAGYRVDFFSKKLSVIAQAKDIFATGKRESYTNISTIYTHELYHPKTPLFTATLTYRINNYKPKKGSGFNGSDSGGNEE